VGKDALNAIALSLTSGQASVGKSLLPLLTLGFSDLNAIVHLLFYTTKLATKLATKLEDSFLL
jgi:hypothetical protein